MGHMRVLPMDQLLPRLMAALVVALLLGACASPVPRGPEAGDTTVAQARADIDAHRGEIVRWGGTIAEVENREDATWLQVVARKLTRWGRPQDTDASEGRFLVRLAGFLDPAIYRPGREITVVGSLDGEERREIGDHSYRFPVVVAHAHELWAVRVIRDDRWRYRDPWYDPWYPHHDPFFRRHPHFW